MAVMNRANDIGTIALPSLVRISQREVQRRPLFRKMRRSTPSSRGSSIVDEAPGKQTASGSSIPPWLAIFLLPPFHAR